MDDRQLLKRITVNPKIFGGKPTIRGLRIKVESTLALLEQEVTPDKILSDYPDLEPEDIRACLAYERCLVAKDRHGGGMKMRFLVDVCAGKELADWLREQGHDVKEVWKRDPRMTDDKILNLAKAEGRVIVTVDKDFGELVVVQGEKPISALSECLMSQSRFANG